MGAWVDESPDSEGRGGGRGVMECCGGTLAWEMRSDEGGCDPDVIRPLSLH